jgi:hypothetical protein
MTDRFYPVGLPSETDAWKTTYEVQNEMRSFARSPYPPGTSVHQPGAREKFGFSSPGPLAHLLAKPETCLEEAVDIPNPRMNQSLPRYREPDDRKVFEHLDIPEMQRSYASPVAAMSVSQGMGGRSLRGQSFHKSMSSPTMGRSHARLSEPNNAVSKIEDDHFTYFVPKALQRAGMEKLKSTTLSRLQKRDKITMPLGSGTGFPFQSSKTYWWPEHEKGPDNCSTSSRDAYQRMSFHRMSPMAQ